MGRSWEAEACSSRNLRNQDRYICTQDGKIKCLDGWIGDLCQVIIQDLIMLNKYFYRFQCVEMTVIHSMDTASCLVSANATWDTMVRAAEIV